MNSHTQQLIRDANHGSSEGRLHFGQVIGMLTQAGVESYVADYRTQRTTYYLPDGDTLSLELPMPGVDIAQDFDAAAVQAAIRGSQQGVVMYPEFKKLSRQAGCIGYTVWIAGRHVSYFGRKGETHVERFPD
jgi:uncharacterized protein YbcV (DUF1398 family)